MSIADVGAAPGLLVTEPASPAVTHESQDKHDGGETGDNLTKNKGEQQNQPATPTFLHSPPDSNNANKSDASDSELSDLDEEPVLEDAPQHMMFEPKPAVEESQPAAEPEAPVKEDIGEVLPDHWSTGVPVFKPTMAQFKDFHLFMEKVDSYGMKSGIIKVIPPAEWKDAQPRLDDLIKRVRVREPIKQDIMGSNGTYRQVNILHGRSYNLPQWRQLCEQSEHQPPARRGERRANADKPKPVRRPAAPKAQNPSTPKKRGRGRPAKAKPAANEDRPMTPVSPKPEAESTQTEMTQSIENDPGAEVEEDEAPRVGRMGAVRASKPKTQSTSARRKYSRREGSAAIDEAAFKDFDYQMDVSEYTPERCEELERSYWKTLTYAPPLYGADLMGTLFDESTETWNLNKLPNILDVLGTQVPGVNTAYLYLGMWKATFAWHLEDVDLYSINYLHFGAPKQWYSISQGDARRFEAAMKNIWPTDAKACNQFLRHKSFLISPHHLLQHYGIRVNKCVSYPGEFVVTYPYGYHSGYNLGYNCAEAVNFALDSWLPMGKIAKRCECAQAQDSVWIDVHEIERKLRGEETEYEETEDEEEDDEDDDDMSGLPTPPASHGARFKQVGRKRKRGPSGKGAKVKVKKIKLRLKAKAAPPCSLCPNDITGLELLPTEDGQKAHRLCAQYLPETYIDVVRGKEVVCNASRIHKDRLNLKCLYCRSKRGACFQCSQKKCARAYHASCAAAAGVFVEDEYVPVFGEDGTEYKEQAFEFSCRFHRTRRDKRLGSEELETNTRIHSAAKELKVGEICQLQYYRGDIFAGMVVENRVDEQTLLVDVIPNGDRVEVEYKWLLLPDPSDYHLQKASPNAIPMPASRKAKDKLNAKRQEDDRPRKDDVFAEGYTWAEFHDLKVSNKDQAKVDFSKDDQIWHYLGKTSTDARAQFTEDPNNQRHNPKGNFLDTIPKPPKPPKPAAIKAQVYRHTPQSAGQSYKYPQNGLSATAANSASLFTSQRFTPNGMPMSFTPSLSFQHTRPYNSATASTQSGQAGTAMPFSNGVPSYQTWQLARAQQNTAQRSPMPAAQAPPPPPAPVSMQNLPQATPQPQAKPIWQVQSNSREKYPFFQVHHNREVTKYLTPYSPWGGFINGYQGDLRAHLIANQSDLIRRAGVGSETFSTRTSFGSSQAPPAQQTPNLHDGSSPATAVAGTAQFTVGSRQPPSGTGAEQPARGQTPVNVGTPQPSSGTQSNRVGQDAAVGLSLMATKPALQPPAKQSPVPLPPYIVAAMSSASSPSTPSSQTKPASLNNSTPGTPTAARPSTSLEASFASQPSVTGLTSPSAGHGSQPAHARKVSASPVPLPSYAGSASPSTAPPAPAIKVEPSETAVSAPVSADRAGVSAAIPFAPTASVVQPQEFSDVPGRESMEFVERMMHNLKRASFSGS